jgi:alpha(1,3/1,4) fucosyltransferase
VQSPYAQDEIFNESSLLNRDNCLSFFHNLKSEFKKNNIEMHTQDITPIQEANYVLYNEMPKSLPNDASKSFALLFESSLIRPDNWQLEKHSAFKKIFTWNDEFVDQRKYFKFNFTHAGPTYSLPFVEKTKFCTLIAGNKRVSNPNELYSKRIETIRWFEKNHPDEFEFYGMGWNQYMFQGRFVGRILNRIAPIRKAMAEDWPSYGGVVKDKIQLLKNFKYSICYENAYDIPGYITEKIFDSMSAGCIPVYWGAPNITQFIPADCFIDRTKFKTHEALYEFLKSISEADYNRARVIGLTSLCSTRPRS